MINLTNFTFKELFEAKGLARLDQQFLAELEQKAPNLYASLLNYRKSTESFTPVTISELLLAIAPFVESFLVTLFKIEEEAAIAQAQTLAENPISAFKKYFVLRRAKKELNRIQQLPEFNKINHWLNEELAQSPLQTSDKEMAVSLLATQYITTPEQHADQIEKLTAWCAHALFTAEAKALVKHWTSFRIPERLDYSHLVPCVSVEHDHLTAFAAPESTLRYRDGFTLTDPRMNAREVQDEVNYCIYCHDHEGDFCSKGFPAKKGDPTLGFKKNPIFIFFINYTHY